MGNILRKLCPDGASSDAHGHVGQSAPSVVGYQASPLVTPGVSVETGDLAALARDLLQFELTGQVPDGLSKYVQSSKTAQANWYTKLLESWRAAQPPPTKALEASQLIRRTLKGHRKVDVEGLLKFYGLSPPSASPVAVPDPAVMTGTTQWPKGVQYELHTLPVDDNGVVDGDTIVVFVDANADAREAAAVPLRVKAAAANWQAAQQQSDLKLANALQKEMSQAGYKFCCFSGYSRFRETMTKQLLICLILMFCRMIESRDGRSGVLARKYRVRLRYYLIKTSGFMRGMPTRIHEWRLTTGSLPCMSMSPYNRGIDAPESSMPYGQEARAMLQSLVEGRPLHVLVYNVDRYGRIVADVHSSDGFIQEILLKKGGCWHYAAYDKRDDFAEWELDARRRRVGLWAQANPQKPWDYRNKK